MLTDRPRDMPQDQGVPASPSGCEASPSAAVPASSQSGVPNAVERVARAIYDCDDPTSGDPLAVLMHAHNPFIDDSVPVPQQLEQVMDICRSAAIAAINAMPDIVEAYIDGARAIERTVESIRLHHQWGPNATPDDGVRFTLLAVREILAGTVNGLASAMSAEGEDAKRLRAKPASAVRDSGDAHPHPHPLDSSGASK